MRIGELASAVGLPAQTIRFYERRGLLPQPKRGPNGYRSYAPPIVTRLEFIRSGQLAGLTLAEIATVLELRGDGITPCTHVRDLLSTKLHDVHRRQKELAVLEVELEGLISRSERLDPIECTDAEICHIIAPQHEPAKPMPAGAPKPQPRP
ncbi:heavy metal-responsive transcriptional regulator [Salinibacterium sp. G-O1]|uniref:heavy metal-responsive transcriptional regulator n=1 Tax=Salinibacterium sp. G-O1 TaxID=3046208 RepID=UPI0024B9E65C|nr:heavy metal-responsive transcriptional regulator [Salinibacterium sp. G-O1]MDJ0334872.1 heavy metal-responsive transcriptional regulator [Salinibacterium sp. G-O1]